MAKKGSNASKENDYPVGKTMNMKGGEHPNGSPADFLGDFAEDLGSLLGTVQKRAAQYLGQRQDLVKKLTEIRDAADGYLQQLGEAAKPAIAQAVKTGKQVAARVEEGRKRVMSEEARARIAAAQKKRWAKHRKAKKAGAPARGPGRGSEVGNG